MNLPRLRLQQQLALAVLLTIAVSAATILTVLFFFNRNRMLRDYMGQSEQMVQAASLAFSLALAANDEVLLDALIHELSSREELHILTAYVLRRDGRVAAHSDAKEYGKAYPVPDFLAEENAPGLSSVVPSAGFFEVDSLLQKKGKTIGSLVVFFSTEHLAEKTTKEMIWTVKAIVPMLALSALFFFFYGRRLVFRLRKLSERALNVGKGRWDDPLEATGADEVTELTQSFNQMVADLKDLRERETESSRVIESLNKDLNKQLQNVKELQERLAEENVALRAELRSMHNPDNIIGADTSLRSLIEQARQVASLPVTVLITGESGTGKELLARYLHEAGSRKENPFIPVNCAAIPVNLIESELFGHERGAFTDAHSQKKGKFEIAHTGTLFLDEVGELTTDVQAKLLRVLQEGEFGRVGSNRTIKVDVRVIAATNRNVADMVRDGSFRQDLLYRLKVIEMHCPPLHERIGDVPLLAQHFIELYAGKMGKQVEGISPTALSVLGTYHWPGNVRELENVIARAVALAKTRVLGSEDFSFLVAGRRSGETAAPAESDGRTPFDALLRIAGMSLNGGKNGRVWDAVMRSCERIVIRSVMARERSQKDAASVLGITPTKMHRLIQKHGLHDGQDGGKERK